MAAVGLPSPSDEDYQDCVAASERLAWKVNDILPADRALDFTRPFLPEALVHLAAAPLSPEHKLVLNHVRAHSYVSLFIFLEEYIIATAMRHAQAEQFGSAPAMRALLRFADEELKHQQLFRRFQEAFVRGFGHPCDVLDNAVEVAGYIMTKPALAVMLTTLHLELITQQHYVDAIKAASDAIEPAFRSMFEHHWLEESQHVRIDTLEIAKLAMHMQREDIEHAVSGYEEILANFDDLLARQAALDVGSFERATATTLSADMRESLVRQQHTSYRQDFLVCGFENPAFGRMMQRLLGEDGPRKLSAIARTYR
jgi:hypothetical protein